MISSAAVRASTSYFLDCTESLAYIQRFGPTTQTVIHSSVEILIQRERNDQRRKPGPKAEPVGCISSVVHHCPHFFKNKRIGNGINEIQFIRVNPVFFRDLKRLNDRTDPGSFQCFKCQELQLCKFRRFGLSESNKDRLLSSFQKTCKILRFFVSLRRFLRMISVAGHMDMISPGGIRRHQKRAGRIKGQDFSAEHLRISAV